MTEKKYNNKKKVLVIGPLPPPYAGTEVSTQAVLNNKKIKEEFTLVHLNTQKKVKSEEMGIFNLKNICFSFLHIGKLFLLLIRHLPNLVYSPAAQNRFGFLRDSSLFLVAKFLRRKVVLHFMGSEFSRFYKQEIGIYQKYIKKILSFVDQSIVISRSTLPQLDGLMPSDRISLIYNPINNDLLNSYSIKKEKSGINVLFLGHISVTKGAVDFVKAIPEILESTKKEIKFIFAGQFLNIEKNIIFIPDPHNAETKIKKIIEQHSLQPYVEFPGVVSGERKIRLFQEVDIFIFPSYSDGFGFAPVEAMACGLPVVGTKVGVLPEIIQDGINGYLIEPGDIEGMVKYVVRLAEDDALRQQMGQSNRILVRERFNGRIFGQRITDLWKQAIESKNI